MAEDPHPPGALLAEAKRRAEQISREMLPESRGGLPEFDIQIRAGHGFFEAIWVRVYPDGRTPPSSPRT